MPDWFAPVVSVIALAFSVLSPLMLGFFDLRKAAQERKMTERRERRERIAQSLKDLIEIRFIVESHGRESDYYAKAYGVMLSIPDRQLQKLAPQVMGNGPKSERNAAIDTGIKRLGEILAQES